MFESLSRNLGQYYVHSSLICVGWNDTRRHILRWVEINYITGVKMDALIKKQLILVQHVNNNSPK